MKCTVAYRSNHVIMDFEGESFNNIITIYVSLDGRARSSIEVHNKFERHTIFILLAYSKLADELIGYSSCKALVNSFISLLRDGIENLEVVIDEVK